MPVASPAEGAPTGAGASGTGTDEYPPFSNAVLRFRDGGGRIWIAGALIAEMRAEGGEETVLLTKERIETEGLRLAELKLVYEDGA